MQEGRRQARERRQREEEEALQRGIEYLQKRRDEVLTEHGKLFDIIPSSEAEDYLRYKAELKSGKTTNLPNFLLQLDENEEHFEVHDLISGGLPIVQQSGWIKVFTKKEAEEFINKHDPPLRKLNGKELYDYIRANNGDGQLRSLATPR